MNCCALIGVPSGCQKVVIIMCWMVRSLPSASLIFARFLRSGGASLIPPDFSDSGFGYLGSFGSGSSGSPSHSGSLKW
ncbi:hypothetical protein D3C83_121420 [compost metagenome]